MNIMSYPLLINVIAKLDYALLMIGIASHVSDVTNGFLVIIQSNRSICLISRFVLKSMLQSLINFSQYPFPNIPSFPIS